MDPRQLRTFAAVLRLASFSAAARELGYTQSGVSQHVATLEAELGTRLMQRRPVAPTEAGARLLEHVDAILLRLDAARTDVLRVAHGAAGRIVVGATPLAAVAAAGVLANARRERPAVPATVRVLDREAVALGVAAGELWAGVLDGVAAPGDPLALPDTGTPVVAAREQPLAVALADDHPLAGAGGLRLEDLVDARWIDAPAVGPPLAALTTLARADGFRAAVDYDGMEVGGVLALAAAGQGLALLPASAVPHGVLLTSPPLVHRIELLTGDATLTLD